MMTDENRRDIVSYRMEKADASLSEALKCLNFSMFNIAANRLYYAFYYAASALLISMKIEAHTHSGVQTMMHQQFIKTGILSGDDGILMRKLFLMRQRSDYEDFVDMTQEDIDDILPAASSLVKKILGLVVL